MRYYLDTNLLVFNLSNDYDEINYKVASIIRDYSIILYVSSVAVKELILLFRIGKLKSRRHKSERDLLEELKKSSIEVVFFNEHHFHKYTHLQIADGHKDMNDHAIIAQAISDKIPLISSDRCFENYRSQGLDFIYNKR
jgi:PIN domain nuclease of toxin-antitoxin system